MAPYIILAGAVILMACFWGICLLWMVAWSRWCFFTHWAEKLEFSILILLRNCDDTRQVEITRGLDEFHKEWDHLRTLYPWQAYKQEHKRLKSYLLNR